MIYSASLDKARLFQQAARQPLPNLQEGVRQPVEKQSQDKPAINTPAEKAKADKQQAEEQEFPPSGFIKLAVWDEQSQQWKMSRQKWGEAHEKFAKDNAALDCARDSEIYVTSIVTKKKALLRKTPGYCEPDKLRKEFDIAHQFKITGDIYSEAEYFKVFEDLGGGKDMLTWQQVKSKSFFVDSLHPYEKTPPIKADVDGTVVITAQKSDGSPATVMVYSPAPGAKLPIDAKLPAKPGDSPGNEPPAPPESEKQPVIKAPKFDETYLYEYVPLERVRRSAQTLPKGYSKLDTDGDRIVTQKEWLKGIGLFAIHAAGSPYDGLKADEFSRFAVYFELSAAAIEKYGEKDLTVRQLLELYRPYAQKALPSGRMPIGEDKEVLAYGILGIEESFDPKKLKERGLDLLFEIKPAVGA